MHYIRFIQIYYTVYLTLCKYIKNEDLKGYTIEINIIYCIIIYDINILHKLNNHENKNL